MAKILLIHHAPTPGGGSTSLLDIARMLRDEHAVTICCPETPHFLSSRIRDEGYDYVPPPWPLPLFNHYNGGHSLFTRTFWTGVSDYFRYNHGWRDAIESLRPDLVIVNSAALALIGPILHHTRTKSVCYVRETFPPRWRSARTNILRHILDRYFGGVVFLSRYDRDSLNLDRPATAVVRDSARPNLFQSIPRDQALAHLKLPKDTFNVLYAGGYSRLKGLDIALKSLTFIEDDRVNLIIAGDDAGPTSHALMAQLRNLIHPRTLLFSATTRRLLLRPEIRSRAHFLGPQLDMSACYSVADVLIFPSTLPHQARPLFEAALYSLPAIASDFENTRESLAPGLNGLTFRPKAPAILARQIRRLREDPSLTRELGVANFVVGSVQHEFQTESEKLRSFVDKILHA